MTELARYCDHWALCAVWGNAVAVAGESVAGQSGWTPTGPAPGSLVAGYRVESRIGAGGMAMVLRARDEALGRAVALKILAPALAGNPEFRERFVREARAVAAVDHPHIIPVYAAGETSGILYLAMRFVVGGDLRSVVQREGPLPGERAVALLSPVASALDAAHAAGLVHRDVKPANILIEASPDRREHPYLSDFGLAKGGSASTGLTGTGQFLGTPDYAAPEQISGGRTGPQADQYALACVAYTIVTGALPFARDEAMAVLWAHMHDHPPRVTDLRPDLPAAVDQVVARALAKAPGERFASCGAFVDALGAALAGSQGSVRSGGLGGLRPSATESAAWPTAGRTTQAQVRRPAYGRAGTQAPVRLGSGDLERPAAAATHRKRMLAAGTALAVAIIGVAVYLLTSSATPTVSNQGAGGPGPSAHAPTTGSSATRGSTPSQSAMASQASCAQLGTYCHIQVRADDPAPLTVAELFPPAFTNEADKTSYSLVSTKVDTTCSNAVIGADLIKDLQLGSCSQVLRASYVSGDATMMGTIGVINLATTDAAHSAGLTAGPPHPAAVWTAGPNDFIEPLTAAKGIASKLGNGTGIAEAEYKGHYLILTWSMFVNEATPSTTAQDNQLEQFNNDLVARTANIDLSQRMVTGTAAASAA
jgi:Protein kinase domain